MLNQKELQQLRELLEITQKPLFMFDNDVDGLASFLLLCRFCGKGIGVAIKSYPDLNANYVRKLHEFKPDYIFVLDKPEIAKGFRDSAHELGMPICWIDHHSIPSYVKEIDYYFNPLMHNSREPVAYVCYQATRRKADEWIALLGCVADWYIPEFAQDFSRAYPDLFPFTQEPGKVLYETELGKLIKMLSFALMDRTSVVVQMLKNLLKIKNPRELLEVNSKTVSIHKRYKQINKKYEKLLDKAKEIVAQKANEKLLFFQYGGELSLSSLLANELIYLYPEKVVVVCYIKGTKVNCALRSSQSSNIIVPELTAKAMKDIQGTYGGHPLSVGATLRVEDLPKFKDNLVKLLK